MGSKLRSCCSTGRVKQQPVSMRGLPYHGKQQPFPRGTMQGQEASRQALLLGLCTQQVRPRAGSYPSWDQYKGQYKLLSRLRGSPRAQVPTSLLLLEGVVRFEPSCASSIVLASGAASYPVLCPCQQRAFGQVLTCIPLHPHHSASCTEQPFLRPLLDAGCGVLLDTVPSYLSFLKCSHHVFL